MGAQDWLKALDGSIAGDVRWDDATRVLYSTDASNYLVRPLAVALPKSADDVAAVVRACADHGVPVTARGGGSGLAGQAIGPGIIIDTSRYMDALIGVDAGARTVRVQPGHVLGMLNKQLARQGLQFGPDPASAERATVGGILGTNATGAHSIRYGMTSDHIEALTCVLADGTLAEYGPGIGSDQLDAILRIAMDNRSAIALEYPKVWRRASGYNLDYVAEMGAYDEANPMDCLMPWNRERRGSNLDHHIRQISRPSLAPLIAGSEGTLGVIVEATLRLVPKPAHTALVIATFASLDDAMRAVPALLSVDPSAVELLGDRLLQLAHDLPEYAARMAWADPTAEGTLVIECEGGSEAEARAGAQRVLDVTTGGRLPCTTRGLYDAASQADVWAVRKMGLAILSSIRGEHKPIAVVEDVAVPVARLAEYVHEVRAIFRSHGTDGVFYAHASAGVLHVRPLVNLRTLEGLHAMHAIASDALALCKRLGGAMSGEHGDGYERTQQNESLFGPQLTRAFEAVKDVFDPAGLLNPGKKVRGTATTGMDDRLKLSPLRTSAPFPTVFAYRLEGGIHRLAEECNGAGVCRKLDSGAMCPSFRVTREEEHSTRGRANLLREYMTAAPAGETAASADTEAVKAALDLCVSCKACARECGSRVDMAKMKSDFLQRYYDARGIPLRAWLLGRIAGLAGLATRTTWTARLANGLMRSPRLKLTLRLSDRPLPEFALRPFDRTRRAPQPARPASDVPRPRVALFVDTFARYNHPQIAEDGIAVLEALGYEVVVPDTGCCGRPLVSLGQPRAAATLARANLGPLAALARAGTPILGLEPSCISMLRDDYPDLVPGPDADVVAGAVRAIEDFVAQDANLRGQVTTRGADAARVLLHGHCHQKAGPGTARSRAALEAAGHVVRELDTTCCGMAGAFGHEAEHAALSRQIGELSLLPAIRAASPDTLIAAAGTSCRQQIEDLAGRAALHPIQIIARALGLRDPLR